MLSVLYLQVGYQPVAAGKSRVIDAGPTRFPYPDEYKRRVPHTTHYPEDMTKCWGSKREKGMVNNAGARQVFRKCGHPYIFLKRGTTHNPAVKWSLKKLGTYCGFFMAITLKMADHERSDCYVVFTMILRGLNFPVWRVMKLIFTA